MAIQLTERELQIRDEVVRGLSNKAIATALNISPETVKRHLFNIYNKVGCSNRVELVTMTPRSFEDIERDHRNTLQFRKNQLIAMIQGVDAELAALEAK
jgi:DNA-binding CsgD family transcriptional regulator